MNVLIIILAICSFSGQSFTWAEQPKTFKCFTYQNMQQPAAMDSVLKDTIAFYGYVDEYISKTNIHIDTFNVIKKDVYGVSTEGAFLKAYYDQNDLKKIEVSYFGEMGKSTIQFYSDDFHGLLAVSRTIFKYDKPIYIAGSIVKSEHEEIYYFWHDTMLKKVDLSSGKSFSNKAEEISKEAQILLDEFKAHKGKL